jgi:hypothetical protein
MRFLILLLAVATVFLAMLLFDTAALVRLTVFCISGGCGVRPQWIAIGTAAAAALFVLLSFRGRGAPAKVAKKRPSGRKALPAGKPRRAKQ